jgi:hypothetical protein
MRTLSLLIVAIVGLIALPALAQNPPQGTPTRIRGTVEKLDGHDLTVKSRDGQSLVAVGRWHCLGWRHGGRGVTVTPALSEG